MISQNNISYESNSNSSGAIIPRTEMEQKLVSEDIMKITPLNNWSDCLEKISKNKDEEAFKKLFEYFAPRVKSFLLKSGGSENQAEESTQEALATVWQKAHLFDPLKASASTWIFTIARNKQLDAIRKINRPEPEELPWMSLEQSDARDAIILQEEQNSLALAVSKLPKKQRGLIEKAFYGDLSHSEIADITKLPLGTVKSRIRLSIDRLRRELGKKLQ